MHVTIGNANEAGRDAVATELNSIGVGSGGAGGAANLNGNLFSLCRLFQALKNARVDVWSPRHGWPSAHLGVADLLLVVAGCVRGVTDVDSNANSGVNAVGAGSSAAQAD